MCAEQYLRRLHGTRKRTCKHFPRVLWHTYIKFARSVLSKVSARFNLARNARQTRLVCSGHRPLLCLLQVLYSTIIAKRLFRFALNILPHPALSLALPSLPFLSIPHNRHLRGMGIGTSLGGKILSTYCTRPLVDQHGNQRCNIFPSR